MSHVTRRTFLKSATVAAGTAAVASAAIPSAAAAPGGSGVFAHSVASGDPLPDRVILWTRVTPHARATPGSGLGDPTAVRWEVAHDNAFGSVVASGSVTTTAQRDHTVKVDAAGLAPATRYFYRFTVLDGPAAGTVSPVGRTKTAPAASADIDRLRFGVCSCSNYEAGHFISYRAMAERTDIDFILHLGDYTYEYESGGYTGAFGEIVRKVEPRHATVSLTDYRIRQGKYHQDPDLARAHAAHPFVCIWDDHESADNSYRDGAENHDPRTQGSWTARKRAATQAYFEWMPVRPNSLENGEHLYRRLRFGTLTELIIPDLRSYRDKQSTARVDDPKQSITGAQQYTWLETSITTSSTRWQVIGSEVMMVPLTIPASTDPRLAEWLHDTVGVPRDGFPVNNDQWDGYAAQRRQLLSAIDKAGKRNVVLVAGDIHSSWASELPLNVSHYGKDHLGRAVACEFTVPSITAASAHDSIAVSRALDAPTVAVLSAGQEAIKLANPWIKDVELTTHGFGVMTVTPARATMEWFYVADVFDPRSTTRRAFGWSTRAGTPKLIRT